MAHILWYSENEEENKKKKNSNLVHISMTKYDEILMLVM